VEITLAEKKGNNMFFKSHGDDAVIDVTPGVPHMKMKKMLKDSDEMDGNVKRVFYII
jgi:hypothetical protein